MRLAFILVCAGLLTACGIVYKLPTRQGNVIEQKQLDQLEVGMTREQVLYLMGTPLAASPFREDRWDYVGYYKSPRGKVSKRVVTLYFDPTGTLARMEGSEDVSGAAEDEREASERDSGVVITPQ
jgi:outer membrane protein assembly factor BamE